VLPTVFSHPSLSYFVISKISVPFAKVCWYVELATIDVDRIPIANKLSIIKLNMLVLDLLLIKVILQLPPFE